ncbi:MAG: ribose-phosphate pyrophosphokinase [Bacteroidales bacterium]|nr:ribose-phosphate pyrophosphokinase [Candidatus Cryptobacteroides aphodequi]
MIHTHRMAIFACGASRDFALKVIDALNANAPAGSPEMKLGALVCDKFSDGEFQPQFNESVRGATVYIIQSTIPPADNLMELLLSIDAAKRASADTVIAVMPYFGWARQDRKDRPRVAIGAKLVANLLHAAGADRVMTCDLHADQIQGFFDIPVDHVYGSKVFIPMIRDMKLPNLAIAAPDMGGAKKAAVYARALDASMIVCHKTRERANVVANITAIGDIEGKDVFIIDDMIDTAGTLCKAANLLLEQGANSVRACASHGVLSGEAVKRIHESALSEVYITDSVPHPELADDSKIRIVSMAGVFASIIDKVYNYEPISPEFDR